MDWPQFRHRKTATATIHIDIQDINPNIIPASPKYLISIRNNHMGDDANIIQENIENIQAR
jgi:hypothetical protein